MFTFSVGISVRRETSDATADDEGIALAIAEETNAADERLAANRKLTEKVNKALISPIRVKDAQGELVAKVERTLSIKLKATHL